MYGDKVDWEAHRKAVAQLRLQSASQALRDFATYDPTADRGSWNDWTRSEEYQAAIRPDATTEAIYRAVEGARSFYRRIAH